MGNSNLAAVQHYQWQEACILQTRIGIIMLKGTVFVQDISSFGDITDLRYELRYPFLRVQVGWGCRSWCIGRSAPRGPPRGASC